MHALLLLGIKIPKRKEKSLSPDNLVKRSEV